MKFITFAIVLAALFAYGCPAPTTTFSDISFCGPKYAVTQVIDIILENVGCVAAYQGGCLIGQYALMVVFIWFYVAEFIYSALQCN